MSEVDFYEAVVLACVRRAREANRSMRLIARGGITQLDVIYFRAEIRQNMRAARQAAKLRDRASIVQLDLFGNVA